MGDTGNVDVLEVLYEWDTKAAAAGLAGVVADHEKLAMWVSKNIRIDIDGRGEKDKVLERLIKMAAAPEVTIKATR